MALLFRGLRRAEASLRRNVELNPERPRGVCRGLRSNILVPLALTQSAGLHGPLIPINHAGRVHRWRVPTVYTRIPAALNVEACDNTIRRRPCQRRSVQLGYRGNRSQTQRQQPKRLEFLHAIHTFIVEFRRKDTKPISEDSSLAS
jgi:hypothetical protein